MPWLGQDRSRLERFRKGDPSVLEQVYRHYAPELATSLSRGFSFSSGEDRLRFSGIHSPAELEDVVQETFVRSLAEPARQSYDGQRPFGSYLFGVAKNLLIDRFRRKDQEHRYSIDLDNTSDSTSSLPPDIAIEREQVRQVVARFEESLSTDDRQLVSLRYRQGLPRREVCDRTGWTPQQLRTRELKLKERLVEFCGTRGLDRPDLILTAFLLVSRLGN